jgi:hypothetical protein
MSDPQARLEYLRGELRAERISYGELAELQGLAEHIDPGDVELLEAAGVPEFPDEAEAINKAAGTYDDVDEVLDQPNEQRYAILLDVQTDWPEVVFVGTFEECREYRERVVTPLVENYGDEAIYYETTAIISPESALAALRERQEEDDSTEQPA